MTQEPNTPVTLTEHRFSRFEKIQWWQQEKLRSARVLVVGAGALGNEVIKNLCLLGVGNLIIADMDAIESSNLSRSILFRRSDVGQAKATTAVRSARDIYPDVRALPVVGNVLAELGLGCFRWAHVVVGALDNREARVFVNRACAQVGRPWIDGGIEVLGGIVRGFAPPKTACYECTMSKTDWEQLAKRRSCSLLARQAIAAGGAPTTPTTASVIGAMQAQEGVKALHGMDFLAGTGFVFEGQNHSSYAVTYPISPECPWHEEPADIQAMDRWGLATPLAEIGDWAAGKLGGLDAIDLSREIVRTLRCPACGHERQVLVPIDRITQADAVCEDCGAECVPEFVHSVSPDGELMSLTVGQLGLPAWDVVWARRGERMLGVELAADRPAELAAG